MIRSVDYGQQFAVEHFWAGFGFWDRFGASGQIWNSGQIYVPGQVWVSELICSIFEIELWFLRQFQLRTVPLKTLKDQYSKHSFENHRQIRLYSECFSGF